MLAPNLILTKTLIITFVASLFFSVLPLYFHMVGIASINEQSKSCPFTDAGSVCGTDSTGHIQAWQSMFTSLPVGENLLILSLLLLAVIASVPWNVFGMLDLVPRADRLAYTRAFIVARPLENAFRRGILNTKVF